MRFKTLLILCLSIGLSPGAISDRSVRYVDRTLVALDPEDVRQISVPIVYENGILFTYAGSDKDRVALSGNFWKWTRRVDLKKSAYGLFYIFVPLDLKKGVYHYRYIVNGIWVNDPQQVYFVNDGYGTRMSTFKLKKDIHKQLIFPRSLGKGVFRFVLKDKGYKKVSLVGTRNNWDPYVEPLKKKSGRWVLDIKMDPRKTFYLFWVDGKTILDPANPNVAHRPHGEKVNHIPRQ